MRALGEVHGRPISDRGGGLAGFRWMLKVHGVVRVSALLGTFHAISAALIKKTQESWEAMQQRQHLAIAVARPSGQHGTFAP